MKDNLVIFSSLVLVLHHLNRLSVHFRKHPDKSVICIVCLFPVFLFNAPKAIMTVKDGFLPG